MKKINDYGIVPVEMLSSIYNSHKHYDNEYSYRTQKEGLAHIFDKYDDIRHYLSMGYVTSK